MTLLRACFALMIVIASGQAATVSFSGRSDGINAFDYSVELTNERLTAGDYFVIYNIAGYQKAFRPDGWTVTVNDDLLIDVTFSYMGQTPISFKTPGESLVLEGFAIQSLYTTSRFDKVYVQASNWNNANKNQWHGRVAVPTAEAVPEPSTTLLLGGGLVMVGIIRRSRRVRRLWGRSTFGFALSSYSRTPTNPHT